MLSAPAMAYAERPFTFASAEFMRSDHAAEAADAFVAQELPAGLPLPTAIARVQKAGARCRPPHATEGEVVCTFFITAQPVGGDLGENWWTVRLSAGVDGKLESASIERSRHGLSGYLREGP
jgi:hypothetical protein